MADYLHAERLRQKVSQCEDEANETYDNLVQWGGALMELSVYEEGDAARELLRVAIERLDRARRVDNSMHHENLWLLGCAHSMRLETLPKGDALRRVDEESSALYFRQAKDLDPTNALYITSNQTAVQAFFTNKLMWGSFGVAGVLACVWKYAFGRK